MKVSWKSQISLIQSLQLFHLATVLWEMILSPAQETGATASCARLVRKATEYFIIVDQFEERRGEKRITQCKCFQNSSILQGKACLLILYVACQKQNVGDVLGPTRDLIHLSALLVIQPRTSRCSKRCSLTTCLRFYGSLELKYWSLNQATKEQDSMDSTLQLGFQHPKESILFQLTKLPCLQC